MDCSGDTRLFELFLNSVSVGYLHCVLGPGAGVVGFQLGDQDGLPGSQGRVIGVRGLAPTKKSVVGGCNTLALGELFVKHGQFGQQHCGLDGIEAAVDAHSDVVVAPVLAVSGNLAHHFGQLIIASKDGTAITVAAQRFTRKEAGARNCAEIAAFAAFVAGSKALGCVFNNWYAVFGGDGVDGVKVGALAI